MNCNPACTQNEFFVFQGAWVYNGVLRVLYSLIYGWILGCAYV